MCPAVRSSAPGDSQPDVPVPASAAVTADKQHWRQRLLANRAKRSADERDAAARALQAHLLAVVADSGWATISGYVPFGDEPGSVESLDLLHAAGVRILLPRTGSTDLTWAAYDGGLNAGRMGILEPTGPDLGSAALTTVDAVFAPALAVDRVGIRIGYGRGYFDRALAPMPRGCPVLAIVYDDELVDALPAAGHDRPVTHTVTPLLGTRAIPS